MANAEVEGGISLNEWHVEVMFCSSTVVFIQNKIEYAIVFIITHYNIYNSLVLC